MTYKVFCSFGVVPDLAFGWFALTSLRATLTHCTYLLMLIYPLTVCRGNKLGSRGTEPATKITFGADPVAFIKTANFIYLLFCLSGMMFKDKVVLVTGGTGSFGSHIIHKLLEQKPKEVRIFSRDEEKQDRMRYDLNDLKNVRFVIGDVRDRSAVERVMRNVDVVFHAAALKQVPSCEVNAIEAVKTNILGAQNVIDAALHNDVKKVVSISTDKAVEPVNAMGMTKALQEKLMISANCYKGGKKTVFCCVRYGNVVGTRGSVVPLFKKQIAGNKPLTITHKGMTRFMLTLDDAVKLVFLAYENGIGGEIFVLKSPAHKVVDLAGVMLEELGAKNRKIVEAGIRPGEKMHETLISPTESLRTIEEKDFFRVLPQIAVPGIEKKYPKYLNKNMFRFSSDSARMMDKEEIKQMLKVSGWL